MIITCKMLFRQTQTVHAVNLTPTHLCTAVDCLEYVTQLQFMNKN